MTTPQMARVKGLLPYGQKESDKNKTCVGFVDSCRIRDKNCFNSILGTKCAIGCSFAMHSLFHIYKLLIVSVHEYA